MFFRVFAIQKTFSKLDIHENLLFFKIISAELYSVDFMVQNKLFFGIAYTSDTIRKMNANIFKVFKHIGNGNNVIENLKQNQIRNSKYKYLTLCDILRSAFKSKVMQ